MTTSPHTRKPSASSGRRAASHALMNSSDLASLCLRSSLTTPRHLAGEDKAPAPRGRDGTSAQALLASTGNIWPTRNTQREANYAQLARHAASGAIPSTRHHRLPAQPTRNIRMAGHVAGHQLQKPRPRDDAHTSRWSRRGGCQYLFFVTPAVIGRVSDAELACCARAFDEAAPALVAAVLAADLLPAR